MSRLASSQRFIIILGALLIAGLFFFWRSRETVMTAGNLKPSQLDFTQSNQVQPLATSSPMVALQASAPMVTSSENLKKLSPKEIASIQMLDEVLKSKNDNDPRIDQELGSMSPAMHEALFEKYDLMEMENRNGRGMIAFLIARDFKTPEDAEFLKKIFNESPCTSMSNCHEVNSSDPHHSGMEQNSLNYPQLAALYQLESKIEKNPVLLKDRQFFRSASEVIQQGKRFPVPVVQDKAEELGNRYGF